eukprot:CAMPEP_0201140422 /NCGR_PEP_ID=MMETSP0851-20130426/2020_1 /ASSEMBLY_ACC=CAM_ASM_000631 /TAXON_ID=183588 /ORGANISM="Pseudo-nitzschia fraudulenta, Strain WWA7" /LENGTH=198 /DNA_ID=CAMNT_0047412973 /DNA_START=1553 /DNA_END=2145 /DNA_ORIENTATION=+
MPFVPSFVRSSVRSETRSTSNTAAASSDGSTGRRKTATPRRNLAPHGRRRFAADNGCRLVDGREPPHPGRVDQLPADRANVHSLVLGDVPPVPSLRGKLDGVPLGVFLELVSVGPDPGLDPVAVFVPGGDLHHLDLVLEGYAGGFWFDGVVLLCLAAASFVVAVAVVVFPGDVVVVVVACSPLVAALPWLVVLVLVIA